MEEQQNSESKNGKMHGIWNDEMLKVLVDSIPGGVALYGVNMETGSLRCEFASEKTFELLGFVREEVNPEIYDNLFERIHPDDTPILMGAIQKAIAEDSSLDEDFRALHKNGLWYWLNLRVTKGFADGPCQYYYGVYSDIDAKKQAETQRLEDHEKLEGRYKEELRNLHHLSDSYMSIMRVNLTLEAVEEIIKECEGEMIYEGMPFDSMKSLLAESVSSDDIRDEFNQVFSIESFRKAHMDGSDNVMFDTPFTTFTGDIKWVETNVKLCNHPTTGHLIAFIIRQDITKRKFFDETARGTLQSDYEYVMRVDGQRNRYYLCHCAIENSVPELGDYDRQMEIYVNSNCLPSEVDERCAQLSIATVIQELYDHNGYKVMLKTRTQLGELQYKILNYTWLNREKQTILMTLQDVTQPILTEQSSQRKVADALRAAERASLAKSEFLSRISQDIRTQMNTMIGMAALALDDLDNRAVVEDSLGKIEAAGKLLRGLTNEVLDMTQLDNDTIELRIVPFTQEEFCEQIDLLVRPQCEKKGIKFNLNLSRVEKEQYHLMADTVRLTQIFFNFLCNSVKFTPNGGEISFLIAPLRRVDDSMVMQYVIRDNGVGMSSDIMNNIFEPDLKIISGANEGGDAGLGLVVAKRFIDKMGGTVNVESELGRGTTITIEIPLKLEGSSDSALSTAADMDLTPLRGRRVLVCEDHPVNAEVAAGLLRNAGMTVSIAADGREGVEKFTAAAEGYFNYILMDIRMPVMDGLQATRLIRSKQRQDAQKIPIIAMTANADKEDIEKSMAVGMNAHMTKPVMPDQLYGALLSFTSIR